MATIPATAFIETALDTIRTADPSTLLVFDAELQEFRGLGQARLDAAKLPTDVTAIEKGYLIGLETARVLLSGMPAAIIHGVEL